MGVEKKVKNIYEKLIEVRKSCEYLKKDNAGFQFKFVSSSQTLGSLRKAMDEQGLLLIPSVLENKVSDHTTSKDGHEYFTELVMTFTWVNAEKPEERIDCKWYGQGLDTGEKGVGKALTYAEKYFLLKFFNIATDKDDPDSFQKKTDTKPAPKVEKKAEPVKVEPKLSEVVENISSGFALCTTLKELAKYAKDMKETIAGLTDKERNILKAAYLMVAKGLNGAK